MRCAKAHHTVAIVIRPMLMYLEALLPHPDGKKVSVRDQVGAY